MLFQLNSLLVLLLKRSQNVSNLKKFPSNGLFVIFLSISTKFPNFSFTQRLICRIFRFMSNKQIGWGGQTRVKFFGPNFVCNVQSLLLLREDEEFGRFSQAENLIYALRVEEKEETFWWILLVSQMNNSLCELMLFRRYLGFLGNFVNSKDSYPMTISHDFYFEFCIF